MPLCKSLHLYGFFMLRVLGAARAGQFLRALSNKRSWVIYGEDYPTSALQQRSRAFRKILSVDQGSAHCFAGRLDGCHNWF